MVMPQQTSSVSNYTSIVKAALIGSTVAGFLFGIFMQMMGMITVIASMAGSDSLVVGWIMHMMISWIFGLGYGAMTYFSSRYYILGVIHGVIIWIVGPLLVMPIMMGMGPMFGQMFASDQLMSLVTHLAFSLILAAVFSRLVNKHA
ncbi:hypothetical protein Plano_1685 [Planococcus sp. PAMC 21323]|uniref:hypothetical protein n=1 Tax=Planococcus sp. PAMC 21323 TaxID=1526927 RepID=UPI00056F1133|nr:hypothetical protein [Planococcus sp. PAMC 21323]AIY05650.1 hypothetical protein Plano_1685 [Planococcus sp. PAMC 21323]